ncbi:MAG: glycosyltransferase family 9 protein [Pirellulales bacterium]
MRCAAAPRARIGWVVEGRSADLLDNHPAIDDVLRVPRGWYRTWKGIREVVGRVRAFAPTVTLDLQGLLKSALLARCSGAKTRIGFGGAEGRELSRWVNNIRVTAQSEHVVDKNLELLSALEIPHGDDVRFDVPRNAAAEAGIAAWVDEQQLRDGYVILNPGAGWASKRWPPHAFAETAVYLGKRCGVRSVVSWAPGEERTWAEEIVTASQNRAVLAPPTNLVQLAALCRGARLFVSGDTGPLHLATAVGTPCVGLFGASDAARNGPYGANMVSLQKIKLEGSSRVRRGADNSAVCAISVEDVLGACDAILPGAAGDHGYRQATAA